MAMKTLDQETSKKVIRQVEFYFSDSNLPKDNFLKKTIGESEDGMVSLALICSFSRMRGHLSLGEVKPEDVTEATLNAVADTLRKSSTFLKISEDGKKVGRTTELSKPEEVIEQVNGRTIAASPLEHIVKMEDVESYFGQFGKVNSVRMPRHVADKRLFCGTALIEFSTEEDAETILKQSLVYGGLELELKPKNDFDAERAIKEEEFKTSPPLNTSNKNNKNNELDYPKGLLVAFKLKSKLTIGSSEPYGNKDIGVDGEEESVDKVEEMTEVQASEIVNSDEKNNISGEKLEDTAAIAVEEKEIESEEKSLKNLSEKADVKTCGEGKNAANAYKGNMDVVLREDLKELFQKYGIVKFIDFKIGDESGYIRFEESEAAQKACAAAVLSEDGVLTVKNYVTILEPVTGEAEKEYWGLLRSNQNNFKGNRGRGGRFNRGGRFSRSRDNDNGNGRANKVRKVAAA